MNKFEPPDGKTLLFVGQDNATIEAYLKESGCRVPAGFMLYTNIVTMDGLSSTGKDYGAGTANADELIRKYPGKALQIGLYLVNHLEGTVRGDHDPSLRKLADWCLKTQVPIFLRIGYEFDGPHNHYDPELYKKAYRYIVDYLRQAGVSNVAYVWHAHAHLLNSPITNWYPGDDYVDWVGISYFSQHQGIMKPVIEFARMKDKPVMIAESTPQGYFTSGGETTWKSWYKRYFEFIDKNDIKAVSYINSHWEAQPMWQGQGWGDARIQNDSFINEKWKEETIKERFFVNITHR